MHFCVTGTRKGSGGKFENIGMKEDKDFKFVILINLLFLPLLFYLKFLI
jgi:hypothetical protein